MAKSQAEAPQSEKLKPAGDKKSKDPKGKDRDVLVGRVKKVVKKSRRKLSEQKFERELQRTITFLEHLRAKIAEPHDGQPATLPQPAELLDEAEPAVAEYDGKKSKKSKKSKKKSAAQAAVAAATAQSETAPGD